MSEGKTSPLVTKLRGYSVILGAILCGIGVFSHFSNDWVKKIYILNMSFRPYELCDMAELENCPGIAMERYFVAVIIITFVLSVLSILIKLETPMQQLLDKGYHNLGAVLLVIGGVLYALSAQQIYNLFGGEGNGEGGNFRRYEKFVAAGLAFIQASLYLAIANRIGK